MRDVLNRVMPLVLILVVLSLLKLMPRNKKPQTTANTITLPRIFLIIGLVGTIFFVGLTFGFYFFGQVWYQCLFFIPLVLLGISIIVAYQNWRIFIDENTARYRTFFRRYYSFEAEDIQIKKISLDIIIIKAKGKTFFIDPYADNIQALIVFMRKNPKLRKVLQDNE